MSQDLHLATGSTVLQVTGLLLQTSLHTIYKVKYKNCHYASEKNM